MSDRAVGTLVVIPVLMALIAMGLVSFGTSEMAVLVLRALWGVVATAVPVSWWSWLAQTLPNNAEAGGGRMVAVIQLTIAIGSMMGGVPYYGSGYKAIFMVAGALLVVSALITVGASRVSQARATWGLKVVMALADTQPRNHQGHVWYLQRIGLSCFCKRYWTDAYLN